MHRKDHRGGHGPRLPQPKQATAFTLHKTYLAFAISPRECRAADGQTTDYRSYRSLAVDSPQA
eukprot:6757062-Prymnesium_polylepis.1